jgi:hypothetical protein
MSTPTLSKKYEQIAQLGATLAENREAFQQRIDAGEPYTKMARELGVTRRAFMSAIAGAKLKPREHRVALPHDGRNGEIEALMTVVGRIADRLHIDARELVPYRAKQLVSSARINEAAE